MSVFYHFTYMVQLHVHCNLGFNPYFAIVYDVFVMFSSYLMILHCCYISTCKIVSLSRESDLEMSPVAVAMALWFQSTDFLNVTSLEFDSVHGLIHYQYVTFHAGYRLSLFLMLVSMFYV